MSLFIELQKHETRKAIREALQERAEQVVEKNIDVVNSRLPGAQQHPDQTKLAMTRAEVRAMLAKKSREIDPGADLLDGHNEDPDHSAEIAASKPDGLDYVITRMNDDYATRAKKINALELDEEESVNPEDHDVNVDTPNAEDVINGAIHDGSDIMFELADGNHIVLDPHSLLALKNGGALKDLTSALQSIESFSNILGLDIAAGEASEGDE